MLIIIVSSERHGQGGINEFVQASKWPHWVLDLQPLDRKIGVLPQNETEMKEGASALRNP